MANTEPMNRIKTEAMNRSDSSTKAVDKILLSDITFEENGEVYEISTTLINPGKGGESQVYEAKARSTGARCVARLDITGVLYDPVRKSDRDKVIKFLREHTEYEKFHIMPLLASGLTEPIKGKDGVVLQFPIDIFPFCQGGCLDRPDLRYTYKELRSNVIPALSSALNRLHEANIRHRDVKPANIFELNGVIVIGDFGTAVIDESGTGGNDDNPVQTTTARGTLGYKAPEVNSNLVLKASDYFSLGCTLATLYNGKHPFGSDLSNDTGFAFYAWISKNGIKMEYRPGDEPLKHLIDMLVKVVPSDRLGYDGVKQWLDDYNSFKEQLVDPPAGQSIKEDATWKSPFIFEGARFDNKHDLAVAMAEKWDDAKRYLYGSPKHGSQVIDFFKWDQTMWDRIIAIVETPPTTTNHDLGLARFIHYLHQSSVLYWRGQKYDDLSAIGSYIWDTRSNKNA
jgi:serine/threonine protein kinase